MSRARGTAAVTILLLLALLPAPRAVPAAAGGVPVAVGAVPVDRPAPARTSECALHAPLSVDLVGRYLESWRITEFDRRQEEIVARIRYKERSHLFRFRVLQGGVLIIRIDDFLRLDRSALHFEGFVARLLQENDRLVIGKYAWDAGEGTVALEHALLAKDGLSFNDFTDALVRLLVTADQKYPELMKALWR